jgi:hypothetical protein
MNALHIAGATVFGTLRSMEIIEEKPKPASGAPVEVEQAVKAKGATKLPEQQRVPKPKRLLEGQ